MSRPQLNAACAAIIANIAISLLLVRIWGSVGAATGAAIGMFVSSLYVMRRAHLHLGYPVSRLFSEFKKFLPHFLNCGLILVSCQIFMWQWLQQFNVATKYSGENRTLPGVCAIVAYLLLLFCIFTIEYWRGTFSRLERIPFSKFLGVK
jgi:peptidoglycan biosynthesis protein MviN/MurJ (putative lipid II flippase)